VVLGFDEYVDVLCYEVGVVVYLELFGFVVCLDVMVYGGYVFFVDVVCVVFEFYEVVWGCL